MSSDALPTGTVTFVFTDIEGSTGLLGRLGGRYVEVLERHQRILRDAFDARGGVEVSTEGDSFFVVFRAVRDAVAAAVDAQRALASETWPEEAAVLVRMGLHTGDGILGGDNYVGVDVHRAARIANAGNGGQILTSSATCSVADQMEGVSFRDLGEHRLKDLPRAERLYQVVADGLPADFPSLRSIDARPSNLPEQLTTFVGRHRELAEIRDAVRQSRLVTLTGPGGTGKTRLSIRAATELLPDFEHGVWFVPLAPITDPALVMPAVAQAVGVPEATDRMPLDSVIDHLRDQEALLVLDNLEQVLDAAGDVGQLIGSTERLRVMATSREALGLHGEREYPVPPLGLPDPADLPSLEHLGQYESVALFIERALAVKPGFTVTNENAPAVAEICTRLDGLPLAIELAAARVKILSPQDILRRLEHSLSFLAGGGRDRPTRQQTLRDAIAWSHELLDEAERDLFARLAVFLGGFDLDAAQAVAGDDVDAFDRVASLVNKSLLRQVETPGGGSRFLMLETIREFAVERLEELADSEDVHRRHAAYLLQLSRDAADKLLGEEQARWLNILAAEHANLRAALTWAEGSSQAELALRLAASLWRFWQMRGHLREAADRFRTVLALPGANDYPDARAEALEAAGGVSYWMADWDAAEAYYRECLELRRGLGDQKRIADAAYNLSFVYTVAPEPHRDVTRSRPLLDEAIERYRALDDRRGIANVLWAMSNITVVDNEWREAAESAREAFELFEELGDRFGASWAGHSVGMALTALGEVAEARRYLRIAMQMFSEAGDLTGIGLVLTDFAALAATERDFERAIRLRAASDVIEREAGQALVSNMDSYRSWTPELSESGLTPEQQASIRAEGEALSVDQAVAQALEDPTTPGAQPGGDSDAASARRGSERSR